MGGMVSVTCLTLRTQSGEMTVTELRHEGQGLRKQNKFTPILHLIMESSWQSGMCL